MGCVMCERGGEFCIYKRPIKIKKFKFESFSNVLRFELESAIFVKH